MTFINKAEVTAALQVFAIGTGTPTGPNWGYHQGQIYQQQGNAMAVNANAPASTDNYVGGMRMDPAGRLYVWPVGTLGVPPNIIYNQGLIFVPDGRLVVTSNPCTDWNGGWPLSQEGWVCMSLSGPPPPSPPGPFTFTVTNLN